MPGISPEVLQQLVQRASQGDPGATGTLAQLGYGPDGSPLAPPGGGPGMPPGGGGPPGMGGGPPMGPGGPPGGGMPPPGGGGMPPPGGGGGMDPQMMQAMQMAQGLRR